MKVKNYYKLENVEETIGLIREWLFNHPDHPKAAQAFFALQVALCAVQLKKDPFIELVLDNLT